MQIRVHAPLRGSWHNACLTLNLAECGPNHSQLPAPFSAFWFYVGSSILMYLMTDTLKRWEWILFLWHISRGQQYRACLSVHICMDSRTVWMIYISTLCLQDSKGLFKYSCLFFLLFSPGMCYVLRRMSESQEFYFKFYSCLRGEIYWKFAGQSCSHFLITCLIIAKQFVQML